MRRTKDDANQTRMALLAAAVRVFALHGYAAAKLEDIAAAAKVTRGAIAHHFGGKAEIFAALVSAKQTVIAQTVQSALALGGSPGERLRRFIVALFVRLEEDEDYRLMSEFTLFHRGEYPASLPLSLPTQIAAYLSGITEVLAAGIVTGEIRADLDLPAATKAVLGLISGVSLNWLLAPNTFSIKDDADQIADAFLAGIFVHPRDKKSAKRSSHHEKNNSNRRKSA